MTLRLVPVRQAPSDFSPSNNTTWHPEYRVPDNFRHSATSLRSAVLEPHPAAAAAGPTATQLRQDTMAQLQRHAMGISAPLSVAWDRANLGQPLRNTVLPQANLGLSIVNGTDCDIDFVDFLGGHRAPGPVLDAHAALERTYLKTVL